MVNIGDATRTPADTTKKGNTIVAVGKEARINNQPVLYAKYVGDLRETGSVGKQMKNNLSLPGNFSLPARGPE